jgi:multimeric flavodoxin WrbA
MKVLAIMGSPRAKGNRYKMVSRIEERMKALGDVEFTYLFLKDVHLELCNGCWQCLS